MGLVIRGSYLFVQPGQKALKVASNYTNYLELGINGITEYYLEAKVDNNDFLINAVLLDSQGKFSCKVVNNFPEKSECRREMTPLGYRILSATGELLLGIEAHGELCSLKGTIYDSRGAIVAQEKDDDFLIFHGPAVLGKLGTSLGIVLP